MTKYLGILFSLMTGFFASAQKPYVELIVQPSEVTVGQAFNVIVKSNISGEINIDFPSAYEAGFNVMNSMEQEFDGNTGEVITFYFHGRSGTLKKEGNFSFGPAYVRRGNKVYKSNKITVVAKTKTCSQNESVDLTLDKKPACGSISVSKNKIYVGEPVVIESKISARFKPTHYDAYQGYLITSGADQHKIEGPQEILVRREFKNNRERFVFELDKQVVFFNHPGNIKIDPFEMTLQSGFDGFEISSKQNNVRVVALPKNAPKHFIGGVGNFEIKSSIDKTNLKQGEITTLTLEISGFGNLHDLSDPKLSLPKELEIYGDPERKEKFSFSEKGAEGTISLHYHMRVLEAGTIDIPSMALSFFDPKLEKYVTKFTQKKILDVETDPSFVVANKVAAEHTASSSMERFDNLKENSSSIFANPIVKWVGITTPICMAFLFLFFRIKKKKDEEKTPAKIFPTETFEDKLHLIIPSEEWLTNLQMHANAQNSLAFFTQLSKNLQHSVSQLSRGDENWVLSKDETQTFFEQKNIEKDFQNDFFALQQTCELCRYGCQTPQEDLNVYLSKAKDIFKKLESFA